MSCEVCGKSTNTHLCILCWEGFVESPEYERYAVKFPPIFYALADYVRRVRAEKANGAK